MHRSLVEVACWCALAAGLWGAFLLRNGGPALTDDSYQYLSVASNIASTGSPATSIIHFDTERSHGVIPAPLTTFPFGYPALIAGLSLAGVPPLTAGWLISFASTLLLIPLLWIACAGLAIDPWIARVLSLLLITNSQIALMATRLATEPLFTLLSAAALLLLVTPRRAAFVAGLALVGAAYYVRYAGLLLAAAVAAYFILRMVLERSREAVRRTLALAIPALMIGAAMLRNAALTGSWKGGNDKAVHNSVAATVVEFVRSMYRIALGEAAPARFSPAELAVVLGLGICLALVLWRLVAQAPAAVARTSVCGADTPVRASGCLDTSVQAAGGGACATRPPHISIIGCAPEGPWLLLSGQASIPVLRPALALIGAYLSLYCIGLCYLGVTSVISFGSRMFVPLLPPLLVLLGIALHVGLAASGRRRAFLAGLALAGAGYTAIHVRHLQVRPHPAPHEIAQVALQPLNAWIEKRVPRNAVLVATNGQATAYALARPAVSLLGSHFTQEIWDENGVHRLMQRFGAEYLIIYADRADPVEADTPFLKGLSDGHAPAWLTLEAGAPRARVYRRIVD